MKVRLGLRSLSLTFTKRNTHTDTLRQTKQIARANASRLGLITLVLAGLSILVWAYYYHHDLTLSYNDARSHLNVSRRVIDNLIPGAAQIGSVWLPLYHILELPFIWNDFMWYTGLAGSIVSMTAFILGGVYLWAIGSKLKFTWSTNILSLAIYSLNPNLLFLQTTPMTESLLVFFGIAVTYHMLSWLESKRLISLLYAAFFTFLATLSRYDGWFLFFWSAMVVLIVSFAKKKWQRSEGNFILYCTLAGFGVFLWLLWNLLIFGDPLYFALGDFSAKAQQDVLSEEGRLLTKGNFMYSLFVYLLTVKYNLGNWISLLTATGVSIVLFSKQYSRNIKLAVSILLSPFFFYVITLVIGHSVIHLPELPPYTWFNDRYGIVMLPLAAISIGLMVNKKRAAVILTGLVLTAQTFSMYVGNDIITIEDGVRGASADFLDGAGDWIGNNITEGLILVAASSNDALMFRSGLPLKQFITEGAQHYWHESLDDPTIHADWVIMHKGDLVYRHVIDNSNFLQNYTLVYHDDFSYIYKKDLQRSIALTESDLPK